MLSAAWATANRWKGRIFLALLDQGVASTANFLLTILYAVWLPLDSFGRYVIIWSVSVLIEIAQVSLIIDSMPAVVSQYGQRNRQRLDVAGTWAVLIYGGLTSLMILAVAPIVAARNIEYLVPLICLAAVNPFQRLYIFFRRVCYIRDRQDAAAMASVAYGAALLCGAIALLQFDLLSVSAAVLLWGSANAAAAIVICVAGIASFQRTKPATVIWLVRELWRSGRWLAGAAVAYWISTWGLFPLVAGIAGAEVAGIIRALQNLFTPIVQFNAALNLAILPRVADKVTMVGHRYARSFAIYGTAAFTGVVLVYVLIVFGSATTIIAWLYRKPEIAAATHLLLPLAVAVILESARQGSSMALLAISQTRMTFVSRVAGVTVFLIGALVLGRIMGVDGILWSVVMAQAVGTGLLFFETLNIDTTMTRAKAASIARRSRAGETLPTLSA